MLWSRWYLIPVVALSLGCAKVSPATYRVAEMSRERMLQRLPDTLAAVFPTDAGEAVCGESSLLLVRWAPPALSPRVFCCHAMMCVEQ